MTLTDSSFHHDEPYEFEKNYDQSSSIPRGVAFNVHVGVLIGTDKGENFLRKCKNKSDALGGDTTLLQ